MRKENEPCLSEKCFAAVHRVVSFFFFLSFEGKAKKKDARYFPDSSEDEVAHPPP